MARLPQPGGDKGTWGTVLNEFLGEAHNTDGSLKAVAQSKVTGLTTDLSSKATQADLDLKAPLASPTFTGTVAGVTKAMVGLGNADDTSDTAKPVSTAQQTALDLKQSLSAKGEISGYAGINASGNVEDAAGVELLNVEGANAAFVKVPADLEDGDVPTWDTDTETWVRGTGGAASKYRDDIQAYNLTGASLRKARTAYAKAKNGEGRMHICLYGDSVTSGYKGALPQYLNSWPARVKVLIDEKTGVPTGSGWIKTTAPTSDVGENRLSYSGDWPASGGGIFANSTHNNAGGTVTIGPILTDRIRVYYLKYSGGGTATVTLDGSPAASMNTYQASGFGVTYEDYTATEGSHTLVITAPTGTDFYFLGVDAMRGDLNYGVRISNIGENGKKAVDLYSASMDSLKMTGPTLAFDVFAPSLSVICFGLNEMNISRTPATFKSEMQALITRLGASTSVLILIPPRQPASNDPGGYYDAYVQVYYELADANNCALLDMQKRWGTAAQSAAEGFKDADGVHPNSRGYWDMGHLVAAALKSTIII